MVRTQKEACQEVSDSDVMCFVKMYTRKNIAPATAHRGHQEFCEKQVFCVGFVLPFHSFSFEFPASVYSQSPLPLYSSCRESV